MNAEDVSIWSQFPHFSLKVSAVTAVNSASVQTKLVQAFLNVTYDASASDVRASLQSE